MSVLRLTSQPGPALRVARVHALVEAAVQVVAELHHVLDVKDVGEVDVEQLEELRLGGGQRLAGEDLRACVHAWSVVVLHGNLAWQ